MDNISQKRSAWVYAKKNPVIMTLLTIGILLGAWALIYAGYKIVQKLRLIEFLKDNIEILIKCAPYALAIVAAILLVIFIFKNVVYNMQLYNAMKYLPLTIVELQDHKIATCDDMDKFLKENMFKTIHRGQHLDVKNIYRDLVKAYEIVLSIEHTYIDKNQDMLESNKRATIICDWLKMN